MECGNLPENVYLFKPQSGKIRIPRLTLMIPNRTVNINGQEYKIDHITVGLYGVVYSQNQIIIDEDYSEFIIYESVSYHKWDSMFELPSLVINEIPDGNRHDLFEIVWDLFVKTERGYELISYYKSNVLLGFDR
jgi:hypothetical protein